MKKVIFPVIKDNIWDDGQKVSSSAIAKIIRNLLLLTSYVNRKWNSLFRTEIQITS